MKCQNLFSGKNMKNISKLRLLTALPRVVSINPKQYREQKGVLGNHLSGTTNEILSEKIKSTAIRIDAWDI